MRKGIREEAGFTLLEVLVTMAVLIIGILGAAGLAISNIDGNEAANRLTNATILARDRMENVRTAGFAGVDALAGTEDYGTITGGTEYKRVVTVAADTPDFNMKTVTVTVNWNSDKNQVSLMTIVAKPGA